MKPSELYEALHALIGERVPLHIWGACGVGKSQIVAQVAADLGMSFSTSGPCNSIRSICAAFRAFPPIAPNGFRPGSCRSMERAFSFSMN